MSEATRRPLRRARIGVVVAGALTAALLAACDTAGSDAADGRAAGSAAAESGRASVPPPTATPSPTPTLPTGARTVFPGHRLVGYAGIAGHGPALGRVGVGDLDDRMDELVELGEDYAEAAASITASPSSSPSSAGSAASSSSTSAGSGSATSSLPSSGPSASEPSGPSASATEQREPVAVLPTLELIATVVQPRSAPGKDGKYRTRASDETVRTHLKAARRVDGILLLAIQPGRSDFVTEVKFYEKWLREPDVGVALDPEWRMHEGQFAPEVFGHVTGKELDRTAAYLSGLVEEHNLPEKVMLYHQLRVDIVRKPEQLKPHPGVAQVVSVDGIGSRSMKEDTWEAVIEVTPEHVRPGFKLFFLEDAEFGPVMTPRQVMRLTPRPDYVMYE